MVEINKNKYGVDMTGQDIQLAACNCSGGSILINQLTQTGINEINSEKIDRSGLLQFSVPEDKAIIKRVKIPSHKNIDGKELAKFEFCSTLLEKEGELYISANSVNGGSEYLVFGCHRFLIDKQDKFFEERLMKPAGYKLRALAMADGYQNYCWREGGELICLLDLSPSSVSYCFVNNNQPIFVGSITNSDIDDTDNGQVSESFLTDLKVTIQYNMSNLFKAGYTSPLSLLVVTGAQAGKETNEAIEQKLQMRTISPTIKTALFAPEIVSCAGQFLVSLGLTVNN